jgi:hypothetical protein
MGHLKIQYETRQGLDQADKLVGCEVLDSFALAHSGIHVAEYSVGVEMVQPIVGSRSAALCIFEQGKHLGIGAAVLHACPTRSYRLSRQKDTPAQ